VIVRVGHARSLIFTAGNGRYFVTGLIITFLNVAAV
jgi:hypothetical protein